MELFLFFFAVFHLYGAYAELPPGATAQLSCPKALEESSCFTNDSAQKYLAVEEMTAAEMSLIVLGTADGAVRRLDQNGNHLRGQQEQRELLVDCEYVCSTPGNEYLCILFCSRRRELLDGFVSSEKEPIEFETKVCTRKVSLADFLVDFPTDTVEECVEDVHCIFEYKC